MLLDVMRVKTRAAKLLGVSGIVAVALLGGCSTAPAEPEFLVTPLPDPPQTTTYCLPKGHGSSESVRNLRWQDVPQRKVDAITVCANGISDQARTHRLPDNKGRKPVTFTEPLTNAQAGHQELQELLATLDMPDAPPNPPNMACAAIGTFDGQMTVTLRSGEIVAVINPHNDCGNPLKEVGAAYRNLREAVNDAALASG